MTVATWLTVGRIFLVPVFVISLAYYAKGVELYRWIAFWVFIAASLTDALDGYIARHWNQKSEFGALLDPIADKLLVVSGFLTIYFSDAFILKPPVWIVIVIISRDIVIISGLLLIFISVGKVRIQPNFLGKITTVFQLGTLAALLLMMPFSPILWNVTAVLTAVSGIVYVIREGKRLNGHSLKQN